MKFIFLLAALVLMPACTNSFSASDEPGRDEELGAMQQMAKSEGWTFSFEKPRQYYTGLIKPPHAVNLPRKLLADEPILVPDTYDLRGKISPIKNQGSCGSCYAFSLTATMQDVFMLAGKPVGVLSEQAQVDCNSKQFGCNGGYFDAADYYMNPGAPFQADYPYTAKDGKCKSFKPAAKIVKWSYVGSAEKSPSIEEMKKAVVKYGPLSVDVAADNIFSGYSSGIYNACKGTGINHMTNIVGWGKDYWIMRNSWGASWGEQGYMRIAFYGKNGKKCNMIGDSAIIMEIDQPLPPPPTDDSFEVDTKMVNVKGKMKPGHVSDLPKVKQSIVDVLNSEMDTE